MIGLSSVSGNRPVRPSQKERPHSEMLFLVIVVSAGVVLCSLKVSVCVSSSRSTHGRVCVSCCATWDQSTSLPTPLNTSGSSPDGVVVASRVGVGMKGLVWDAVVDCGCVYRMCNSLEEVWVNGRVCFNACEIGALIMWVDVVLTVAQNIVCPWGDEFPVFVLSSWLTSVNCSFASMFVRGYAFPGFGGVTGGAHTGEDLFLLSKIEVGCDGFWFVVLFTVVVDGFCQLQSIFWCTRACEEVKMGFLVEVPYVHAPWAPRIYLYSVFRISSEGPVVCS